MFILSICMMKIITIFFSSRRRHTRYIGDWSSDVCSSDLRSRRRRRGRRRDLQRGRACGRARGGPEIGRASCRERVGSWGAGRRGKSEEEYGGMEKQARQTVGT